MPFAWKEEKGHCTFLFAAFLGFGACPDLDHQFCQAWRRSASGRRDGDEPDEFKLSSCNGKLASRVSLVRKGGGR